MKNILFMVLIVCLVLVACHSSRGRYVYDIIPLDKAWLNSSHDDFGSSFKHISGLDLSKDGYYFVYSRGGEFDEPTTCLFFYDKGDSLTICPFDTKKCRKYDIKSMDIPVEGVENALPLRPHGGIYSRIDILRRITGYKKEGEKKQFFRLYPMDGCSDTYKFDYAYVESGRKTVWRKSIDSTCKDKWKQSVEENIEQFILNGKMFNRLEHLVNRLFIKEKIDGWREAGLMPEDEYEDAMRRYHEKMSNLEREYEELLNMSVPDSAFLSRPSQ